MQDLTCRPGVLHVSLPFPFHPLLAFFLFYCLLEQRAHNGGDRTRAVTCLRLDYSTTNIKDWFVYCRPIQPNESVTAEWVWPGEVGEGAGECW